MMSTPTNMYTISNETVSPANKIITCKTNVMISISIMLWVMWGPEKMSHRTKKKFVTKGLNWCVCFVLIKFQFWDVDISMLLHFHLFYCRTTHTHKVDRIIIKLESLMLKLQTCIRFCCRCNRFGWVLLFVADTTTELQKYRMLHISKVVWYKITV